MKKQRLVHHQTPLPIAKLRMEPNKVLLPSIDSNKDVDAINGAEPNNKANILQDNS